MEKKPCAYWIKLNVGVGPNKQRSIQFYMKNKVKSNIKKLKRQKCGICGTFH